MFHSLKIYLCLLIFTSSSPLIARCRSKMSESDYFLLLLVDAKHLDYSNTRTLLKSMAKHPGTLCKNSQVGHSWIYLRGVLDGRSVELEGGHSGELGVAQAKYFEGIMNNIDYGYDNPTEWQVSHPRLEPGPIKYLWQPLNDGYYEEGSGRHRPTYAAKLNLTPEQFHGILEFINEYSYESYSLTQHQCTTFVAQIAALIGRDLTHDVTVKIDKHFCLGGEKLQLWSNHSYSQITLPSPDILEGSLKRLVCEGDAEYALDWYFKHRPISLKYRLREFSDSVRLFPSRFSRYMQFLQASQE